MQLYRAWRFMTGAKQRSSVRKIAIPGPAKTHCGPAMGNLNRANAPTLTQERAINITKTLGMLLLAIYLILVEIMALVHVAVPVIVTGVLALEAAILILNGK